METFLKLLYDIIKLLIVVLLFSFPFYAFGLFWGIEYGEYYGLFVSLIVSLVVILTSNVFFHYVYRAKKKLKDIQINNAFLNKSFLMGIETPTLISTADYMPGLGVFRSLTGKQVVFINERAFKVLKVSELRLVVQFALQILQKSSNLRFCGAIFIFLMGRPFYFMSKVKYLDLLAHFFFIPFKFLNNLFFSLESQKELVFKLLNDEELRIIKSSLKKLALYDGTGSNVFNLQIVESCFLTTAKENTLYDLIVEGRGNTQDILL